MSTMQFLTGGGTMGARIQAFDWSASPLGTPETWLPSLRVTLSNMLRSKMPTYLLWGAATDHLLQRCLSPAPRDQTGGTWAAPATGLG